MADGMAYVSLMNMSSEDDDPAAGQSPSITPLPSSTRLLWDATLDHFKHDIWNLWPIKKSFIGSINTLSARSKAPQEPRINPLRDNFPRMRFNYALSVKLVVSNVQGPSKKPGNDDGELLALYSAGPRGEGLGLNIAVWSYVDQLNVGILACHKTMPDLYRLPRKFPVAVEELRLALREKES